MLFDPILTSILLAFISRVYEKLLLKSEFQAWRKKKFVKRIEFRKIKMLSFNTAVADTFLLCQGDKRKILDSKNSAGTMKHYIKNIYYFY